MKKIEKIEINIFGKFNEINKKDLDCFIEELKNNNIKYKFSCKKINTKAVIEASYYPYKSIAIFSIANNKIKITIKFEENNVYEIEKMANITSEIFNDFLRGGDIKEHINKLKCKIIYVLSQVRNSESHLVFHKNIKNIFDVTKIDVNDKSFILKTETKCEKMNFNDVDMRFSEALQIGIRCVDDYINYNKI